MYLQLFVFATYDFLAEIVKHNTSGFFTDLRYMYSDLLYKLFTSRLRHGQVMNKIFLHFQTISSDHPNQFLNQTSYKTSLKKLTLTNAKPVSKTSLFASNFA